MHLPALVQFGLKSVWSQQLAYIILHEVKEAVRIELWRRDADRICVVHDALEAAFKDLPCVPILSGVKRAGHPLHEDNKGHI